MKDMVTSLKEDKRGYRVTVNDGTAFRLSFSEYRDMPLHDGDALDWETYRQALLLRQYPEALDRAVGLLALRAHSHHEVERRLIERGYLPDTIEMVMLKLEQNALLDDTAFATAWVRQRAARGIGKARLLQDLRVKGVDNATAQAALDTLDADEQAEPAIQLAGKLLRRHHNLPEKEVLRKSIMAMQRRGYGYGDASRALQTAIERLALDSDDDPDWDDTQDE